MSEIILRGIPAAPGVVVGKAYLFGKEEFFLPARKISKNELSEEIARFEEALIQTRHQILDIQKKITQEMDTQTGEIFEAHLLVLEDRMLIEEVISRLKRDRLCVEFIFSQVLKKYIKVFSSIEDEYLRERITDVNDVGRRVIRNLLGKRPKRLEEIEEKMIVVAHDISPSDTAAMHKRKVLGFVTDVGGRTTHTAIMAKSLEIPAVVGLEKATAKIKAGREIIVDGNVGIVIVEPQALTKERYRKERKKIQTITRRFLPLKGLPALTVDGKKVELAANIEFPEEILSVIEHGAEGIGLYRTEYFYMNRQNLPTEEEHYQAYRSVAEAVFPHSVIIRTLDLGGDKFLSSLKVPKDMLPFLGWRAIRFCVARPDIFKTQLRAILRASVSGKLKLMYPMISGIEELHQANKMLEKSKEELRRKRIPFNEDIDVGAMIEIPSAALTCDILAEEVDFFSIGTNDLIQYSLAIDRTNEKIAYLYEPTHPAVLRLIKNIIEAGHKAKVWVGMCGEMAGEPAFALLLLGLGLDEFSVSPMVIPQIKRAIRSISYRDAQEIAKDALGLSRGKEVEDFLSIKLKELVPELVEVKNDRSS